MIADLGSNVGQRVVVRGWLEQITRRPDQEVELTIKDRTGRLTAIARQDLAGVCGVRPECAIEIEGVLEERKGGAAAGVQLTVERLDALGLSDTPLPVRRDSRRNRRLDFRFLDLREPEKLAVFEISSAVEQAIRLSLLAMGSIEIHSPKLTASGTESGATVFEVDFFDRPAYLVQSNQFYRQLAMAAGMDSVFEVGPVFRAERSHSLSHLVEFTAVEAEVSWITSHHELMDIVETLLADTVKALKGSSEHLRLESSVTMRFPSFPLPRIPLNDARALLERKFDWQPRDDQLALDRHGERLLCEWVEAEFANHAVFVTDYPAAARPFYQRRNAGGSTTMSFDLLSGGLEIGSGSVREHRYAVVTDQARHVGIAINGSLETLLQGFRYGCPPHGGFGFGLNRLLMALLGLNSIIDATFVPRMRNRLVP